MLFPAYTACMHQYHSTLNTHGNDFLSWHMECLRDISGKIPCGVAVRAEGDLALYFPKLVGFNKRFIHMLGAPWH